MIRTVLLILVLLVPATAAIAAPRFPPRPDGVDEFVADEAGIITAEHRAEITELGQRILIDLDVAIRVVTIDAVPSGLDLESYAGAMRTEWKLGGLDVDLGILLLVLAPERRAWIDLGEDWVDEAETVAADIVAERIEPEFERGRLSLGVLEGVRGLKSLARNVDRNPFATWLAMILITGLLAAGVILFGRRSARSAVGEPIRGPEALEGVPRWDWRTIFRSRREDEGDENG